MGVEQIRIKQWQAAVKRIRDDPQPVHIEMNKLDAMLLMQNVLLACRHPEHVQLTTHGKMVDLAESVLRLIAGESRELQIIVDANMEGVPR